MFEDLIIHHFWTRSEMAAYRTSYGFLLIVGNKQLRLWIASRDVTFVPGFVKIGQFIQKLKNSMEIS
jgi:hypothetical protein